MECEFCKKEFKTIGSLNYHMKTAKYCLKIRGVAPSEAATFEFAKKDEQLMEKDKQHRLELAKKDEQLMEKDRQLLNSEKIIIELETSLRIYKEMNERDHRDIVNLAKGRTTTTNTTTTNNLNCPPLTQEHFDANCAFSSLDHIEKGVQGYARYVLDYYPHKGEMLSNPGS